MRPGPVIVGVDGSANATAEEESAWMIVVGTRGHRRFAAVPLGSTSFKVVMASDRPVLVVPPG